MPGLLVSLGRNIVVNYVGQGWTAFLGVIFVPMYAAALGVEAYGLVGAFVILYACVSILDLGISQTLTREMARLGGGRTVGDVRDLLRSLEWVSVVIALMMVVGVSWYAPALSRQWLNVATLPEGTVITSLRIMAPLLATRWLEQVYRGSLQGLGDFLWLNGAQAIFATLRWVGAYLVVVYVETSVFAFFMWQLWVSVATLVAIVWRTYLLLPKATRPARFSLVQLLDVRAYASGLFVVSILTFVLTQIDRIAVSTLLSLEQLGLYSIAAAAAGGLMQVVTPINSVIYPRLTQLVTAGSQEELCSTYMRSCDWMALAIVPPAIMMSVLPRHTLFAWSGDPELSLNVAPVLTLLSLGSLCNAFMNPPYMMQLAHGWTGLAIRVNIVAVLLVVPAVMWATPRFGTSGAAAVWLVLNASYIVIGAHFMHRRLIPQLKWTWYAKSVALPLLVAAVTGALAAAVVSPSLQSRGLSIAICIGALAATFITTAVSLDSPRETLRRVLFRGGKG